MKKELQEAAFTREIEKRIDQLANEFDLSYSFVVGALSLILHGIKAEYFEDEKD